MRPSIYASFKEYMSELTKQIAGATSGSQMLRGCSDGFKARDGHRWLLQHLCWCPDVVCETGTDIFGAIGAGEVDIGDEGRISYIDNVYIYHIPALHQLARQTDIGRARETVSD